MSENINLNVRVSGSLCEYVRETVGDTGAYDNASEYVRDLIRKDKERHEKLAFERLRAELQQAFSADDGDFLELSTDDIKTGRF